MNLKSSLGSPPSPFLSLPPSLPPSPSLKLGRELLEARGILRAESQAGARVHVDQFKGVKLKQPKVCVQKIERNKKYYHDNKDERQKYNREYWASNGQKYVEKRMKDPDYVSKYTEYIRNF